MPASAASPSAAPTRICVREAVLDLPRAFGMTSVFGNPGSTELPKPYVKWSIEPARAEDVSLAIARAYSVAMTPPCGPVLVSIPADDWTVLTEPVLPRRLSTRLRPEPELIEQLGAALDKAQRPAIVIGAAVNRDGAWAEAVQLAERHNARVFAAPMSGRCGFPEDHRLFAGFLPAMRERINDKLAGHDVIFALGAPAFTYHVEGHGPHVPAGTELIQLIDDPAIAAWAPVGMAAIGSIRLGLLDLLARAAPAKREPPSPREPVARAKAPAAGERMSVAFALQTLADVRDAHSIVVEEAPSSRSAMQQHLPMLHSETFYTMCSGGLGHSLPVAVGVALPKPGTRVIALLGDGSAMYSIQALWSAAQLKLPITVVVLKNRRYAALQEFGAVFGYGPCDTVAGTDPPDLDFVALAAGHGMKGVRVSEASELGDVLVAALQSSGPMLVEIDVA